MAVAATGGMRRQEEPGERDREEGRGDEETAFDLRGWSAPVTIRHVERDVQLTAAFRNALATCPEPCRGVGLSHIWPKGPSFRGVLAKSMASPASRHGGMTAPT